MSKIKRRILLVGHPSPAMEVACEYLKNVGIDIAYNGIGPDGVCAWTFAKKHKNYLNGQLNKKTVEHFNFDYVIRLVENPSLIIPYINIVENKDRASLSFRNKSVGLDSITNKIEHAAQSYLRWHELIDHMNPTYDVRYEFLNDDVQCLLQLFGLRLEQNQLNNPIRLYRNIKDQKKSWGYIQNETLTKIYNFSERYNYEPIFY